MISSDRCRSRGAARLASVGFLVLNGLLAGCGGSGDGFARFPAEGTVTLDGSPLPSGTISFNALQQGASASTEIVNGAFRLRGDDGLSPGPYRVEIYSIQPTGRKVPDSDDPKTLVDERVNVVPRPYNVHSTLKAEIPPGGPKEPFTFPIVGSSARKSRR